MQPTKPQGRFLTVGEVAQILRVSKMTVYRMISLKQIEHVKVLRSFRIPEAALDNFIKEQTEERLV